MNTCLFLIGLTCNQNPKEIFAGFLFLLSGIPAYYIVIVWKNKPEIVLNVSSILLLIN